MKKFIKQVLGIDVAQKELVVALGRMDADLSLEIYASKILPNNKKGFKALVEWVRKITIAELPVSFVMEATGVYHESLAYFLDQEGLEVSVVLPNKISNYFRTLEVKTITDKTASETITHFGLERKLDQWHRPNPIFKKTKQLTRERDQVVTDRTIAKNQLHAENAEAEPNASSIKRIKKRIELLDKQEKEINREIKELSNKDGKFHQGIKNICSIPGMGLLTAATILAETNGFELIRNKRQLTSYAGMDIKEKLSGTSVKGKPKISKRGNRHLRKALYLPALAAIRCDKRLKGVFENLVSKHGIKMKAAVAVQRKMLELAYILYVNNTTFDPDYIERAPKSIITECSLQADSKIALMQR